MLEFDNGSCGNLDYSHERGHFPSLANTTEYGRIHMLYVTMILNKSNTPEKSRSWAWIVSSMLRSTAAATIAWAAAWLTVHVVTFEYWDLHAKKNLYRIDAIVYDIRYHGLTSHLVNFWYHWRYFVPFWVASLIACILVGLRASPSSSHENV